MVTDLPDEKILEELKQRAISFADFARALVAVVAVGSVFGVCLCGCRLNETFFFCMRDGRKTKEDGRGWIERSGR